MAGKYPATSLWFVSGERKAEKQKTSSEDPIESSIGEFGKWQLYVCVALALIKVPVAWHQLEIVFLAPPANFTCVGYNSSARYSDAGGDQCVADGIKCTEWEYDRSIFEETIITQWNLVCDRAQLANVAQTVFMFGVLIGSVVFGMAADKYGRKGPLMISILLQAVSGIAIAYVPLFTEFLILRFTDALATGGQMVVSFVICMEMIGQKWRTLVSVLYHLPFNIGHSLLPVVSYFLRDWRHFQVAISLPSILMLVYWWFIPESPRWLLTVGRRAEALAILEKGAKINRLPKPSVNLADSKAENGTEDKSTVLDLFRTPNLRKRTLCIYFNWLVSGLCFFGLVQYMGQIGGNIFVNVAISGLIELPGALTCTFFMEKFGRKLTVMGANLLSGIACLLIMAAPEGGSHWPRVALSALGVVGTSISFPTIYLYSGEIFPTVVRNVGIGTSSMCARLGSMIAPFVTSLAIWSRYLPPLVFGIVPLMGALFTLMLPETARTVLPDTIEEGEEFGKVALKGKLNKSFEGE